MTLLVKYLVVILVRWNISCFLRLLVAFWIVAMMFLGKTSQQAWSWTATSTTLCMNTRRSSENLPFLPLQLCCSRYVVMVMVVMVIFFIFYASLIPCGKVRLSYLAKATAAARPISTSLCSILFVFGHWYGCQCWGLLTRAQMLMHVTAHGDCTL